MADEFKVNATISLPNRNELVTLAFLAGGLVWVGYQLRIAVVKEQQKKLSEAAVDYSIDPFKKV